MRRAHSLRKCGLYADIEPAGIISDTAVTLQSDDSNCLHTGGTNRREYPSGTAGESNDADLLRTASLRAPPSVKLGETLSEIKYGACCCRTKGSAKAGMKAV